MLWHKFLVLVHARIGLQHNKIQCCIHPKGSPTSTAEVRLTCRSVQKFSIERIAKALQTPLKKKKKKM